MYGAIYGSIEIDGDVTDYISFGKGLGHMTYEEARDFYKTVLGFFNNSEDKN